jgi:HEAT repeat protein
MTASSLNLPEAIAASRRYVLDPSSRRETRPALERLRQADPKTLDELVSRLRRSTDSAERAVAILLAPHLPGSRGLDVLFTAVDNENDPIVLAAAAEALGDLEGGPSSDQLERLAEHPDAGVRRAVAANLYGKDDSTALSTLMKLIKDKNDDVRDWAAWALADNFEPSSERDTALTRWLSVAGEDSQLASQVRTALESPQTVQAPPRPSQRTKQPRAQASAGRKITVLVASANPLDTDRLALDEEVRDLTAGLRGTPAREIVDLRTAWAARPLDLLVELNEYQPEVLHFSGHGTPDGRLVFLDTNGNAKPVDGSAISSTLATAGDSVRVVVLNACFSAALADSVTEHVDVAVGMNRPVGDEAARVFARAFYSALGYGLSVGRAFEQGRTALMLEGLDEHNTPELAVREGIDPHELVLVDRPALAGTDPTEDRSTLQRVTTEHLAHLKPHASLPVGEGLEIDRASRDVLRRKAEAGSLLLVGPPGSGKSGAVHRLASDLTAAGRDVVVLAADLLSASGRRGLREELDIRLDLVDALAAWPGKESGFLIIDALDAARGREAASVLLEIIERVAGQAGRWHVVASVRSFDLRHNRDLRSAFPSRPHENDDGIYVDAEFTSVRHLAIAGLSDPELADLATASPDIHSFFIAASPELQELLRVPFNLRLLAGLLGRDCIHPDRLHAIRTQLELLDLYWENRVLTPATGRDARELLAKEVCEVAIKRMRLQVPRAEVREAATVHGPPFDELLSSGVLVETPPAGTRKDTVGFAHHVLFDYAVHRLLLTGEPDEIADRLATSDELALLARPSLVFTLDAEWEDDATRRRFWSLALRLAAEDIPVIARLVAPTVAAERVSQPADLAPLLAAIDRREAQAPFVLRHLVGARAAAGLPTRPLAGGDLGLWSQVAVILSERISQDIAYPLRILIWGLSAEVGRLEPTETAALGVSARALLDWAWAQDPPPPQELTVALEAVARSCRADPETTEALLRRVVDPERLPQSGYTELRALADELPTLASCVPDLAARLFEAAFGYDEQSEETTSFGSGQILPLTSTRRQDWAMIQYSLAQQYLALLEVDTPAAVRALAAASMHEADRSPGYEQREITRFRFLDGEAGAISDGSAYWDSSSRHRDVSSMLEAFEEALAASAANDGERAASILRALVGEPRPAAIWRRVFRAAARAPDALARQFAEVVASPDVLISSDLREPVCNLLRVGPERWGPIAQRQLEDTILGLPDRYPPERREAAEHLRDRLLGCIPVQALETERAKGIRAEMEANGVAAPPPDAFDFSPRREVIDAEDELRERGIDPSAEHSQTLVHAIEPISAFVGAHVNDAPSSEEIHRALPDILRLRELNTELEGRADRALLDDARAWLSEAAAALAWQTPLPVGDESVELARELALEGARSTLPRAPEHLEQFDNSGPSWGVPSGRIDAARALLLLSREPQTADSEVLARIQELAQDEHPAVRWMVAQNLGLARESQADRVWNLVMRMADDPSAQVRQALLHPLAQFARERIDDVTALVRRFYDEEVADRRHEGLIRATTSFLIDFWIWQGHPSGRKLIDEWIEDIEHNAKVAQTMFFGLRTTITHGGSSADDVAVRQRAIAAWADVTRAARDSFATTEATVRANERIEPERTEQIRDVARLLDMSATELYFGSGAYAEQQGDPHKRLNPATRQRFYGEGSRIIDVLVTAGIPAVAHHVLETLSAYVEFDPRGILLRIGRVLEAGREWGYQLEGLAEKEFVRIVELYLASHRDLLVGDRESRRILLTAVEGFVEAGWPSARKLLYGLDDMFR